MPIILIAILIYVTLISLALMFLVPEVPIIAVLAVSMLLNTTMIQQIGFPQIGLNLMDLTVLVLPGTIFFKRAIARQPLRVNKVFLLWLVLFIIGTIGVIFGLFQGAILRSALRDYRFFVYSLVIYAAIFLTIHNTRQIWRLIATFYILVSIEAVLMATGVLNRNPQIPQLLLITSSPGLSVLHFTSGKSYFPMLISMALLVKNQEILSKGRQIILYLVTIVSLLILILSLNRTQWTAVPIALGGLILLSEKKLSQRLKFLALLLVIIIFIVFGIEQAARSIGVDDFRPKLVERFLYVDKFLKDNAALSRLLDAQITLEETVKSPIWGRGLGLGDLLTLTSSDFEVAGAGIHMGYLWLAYRIGFPGLIVFLWILVNTFRVAYQSRRFIQEEPYVSGLMLGLIACLIILSIQTFFSTDMVNFSLIPYWGFVIGLIHVLHRITTHKYHQAINMDTIGFRENAA